MKKVLLLLAICLATVSNARDTVTEFSISEAMKVGVEKGVLLNMPVYFKGMKVRKRGKKVKTIKTNKKTNAFAKSDKEACQWVFLSAVKALQASAKKLRGKAVINIVSNYKSNVYSSRTKFQCGAGQILAGVALKGDVIR